MTPQESMNLAGHIADAMREIPALRDFFNDFINESQRPSVLYRPSLSIDGNMWCALYGANLQDGVAGFGETPEKAMLDFDKNWRASNA